MNLEHLPIDLIGMRSGPTLSLLARHREASSLLSEARRCSSCGLIGSRSYRHGRRLDCGGCRAIVHRPCADREQDGDDDCASDKWTIAGLFDVPRRIRTGR
jgi:hypothetical protein